MVKSFTLRTKSPILETPFTTNGAPKTVTMIKKLLPIFGLLFLATSSNSLWADFLKPNSGTPLASESDEAEFGSPLSVIPQTPNSSASQIELSGRSGYKTESVPAAEKARYFYFKVADATFKKGNTPSVILTLTYFDEGPASMDVLYDSSDEKKYGPDVYPPGTWKPLARILLHQTRSWCKIEIPIADAYFGGRMRGGDVRLQWGGDIDAVIGKAYLKPAN